MPKMDHHANKSVQWTFSVYDISFSYFGTKIYIVGTYWGGSDRHQQSLFGAQIRKISSIII